MTTSGKRILGAVLGVMTVGALAGATTLGDVASRQGWGAEEPGVKRLSLRQESVGGRGFFHSWSGRSHFGGGLGLGK